MTLLHIDAAAGRLVWHTGDPGLTCAQATLKPTQLQALARFVLPGAAPGVHRFDALEPGVRVRCRRAGDGAFLEYAGRTWHQGAVLNDPYTVFVAACLRQLTLPGLRVLPGGRAELGGRVLTPEDFERAGQRALLGGAAPLPPPLEWLDARSLGARLLGLAALLRRAEAA